MSKLSIEDLLVNSASYDRLRGVSHSDAAKATDLHRRITATRNPEKPMPGDIMICKGKDKEYFSGHVAYENLSKISAVCVKPYIPFITSFCCRRNEFNLDTSGGYWFRIRKENLFKVTYVGKRDKLFKAWGHCGSCANVAFTFSCEVNVWEYYSDDIY